MDAHLAAQAAHHAIRLWIGLENVKDVITWADALIVASTVPTIDLIDLSSAFREPPLAILRRLRALTSEAHLLDALRATVPDVATRVQAGDWSLTHAVRSIRDAARTFAP